MIPSAFDPMLHLHPHVDDNQSLHATASYVPAYHHFPNNSRKC
jgi:hypothetical protein